MSGLTQIVKVVNQYSWNPTYEMHDVVLRRDGGNGLFIPVMEFMVPHHILLACHESMTRSIAVCEKWKASQAGHPNVVKMKRAFGH